MKNENEKKLPEGYRKNAQGHLVPEDIIPPLDKIRDDLVREGFKKAEETAAAVAAFRDWAADAARSYMGLAEQEYSVSLGGTKGNLTLTSYDGTKRWTLAVSDTLSLESEEMALAMKLINECISKWSDGSNPGLVKLVMEAFRPGKNGQLSAAKVWPLLRYEIDDETWKKAMELVKKGARPDQTREYLRFHVRSSDGSWQLLFKC